MCGFNRTDSGIPYAHFKGMELLGRIATALGISLVLTLLLLAFYQDDGQTVIPAVMTQAVPAAAAQAAAVAVDTP